MPAAQSDVGLERELHDDDDSTTDVDTVRAMNVVDLIVVKRDGARLSDEQIAWFIDGVTHGAVPEHQASALLMAILFRGMAPGELAVWTRAMIDSGSRLDLSSRWLQHAAPRCRNWPVGVSATPAARSTRWRPSPGSAVRWPLTSSCRSSAASAG
jgi:hypothetical protein